MPTVIERLAALRRELEFLENGGYRRARGWRPPFIFEDSAVCPKLSCSACPLAECVLIDFVPERSRNQKIPCRHIPLDETEVTLEMLYATATNEEIEQVLRKWLRKSIAELARDTQCKSGFSAAA
jgi:hypothetical protein